MANVQWDKEKCKFLKDNFTDGSMRNLEKITIDFNRKFGTFISEKGLYLKWLKIRKGAEA